MNNRVRIFLALWSSCMVAILVLKPRESTPVAPPLGANDAADGPLPAPASPQSAGQREGDKLLLQDIASSSVETAADLRGKHRGLQKVVRSLLRQQAKSRDQYEELAKQILHLHERNQALLEVHQRLVRQQDALQDAVKDLEDEALLLRAAHAHDQQVIEDLRRQNARLSSLRQKDEAAALTTAVQAQDDARRERDTPQDYLGMHKQVGHVKKQRTVCLLKQGLKETYEHMLHDWPQDTTMHVLEYEPVSVDVVTPEEELFPRD